MTVTGQPISVSFIVDDIVNVLPLYDRLRWFRGRNGPNGEFEATTAPTPQPAVLTSGTGVFGGLNGKRLKLQVDGAVDVGITFSSPNPVDAASAASEINSSSAFLSATNVDNRVVMSSVSTGSSASIVVVEGTDAFEFGWAVGQSALGRDTDFTLIPGVYEYIYTDQNSDPSYWYRTQFWHSSGVQHSTQSVSFPSNAVDHVSLTNTITGFLRLTDLSGRPIECRKITFFNTFSPNTVEDSGKRWGSFRHSVEVFTNRNGYAEVRLLRGLDVDMAIDGTGYIRRLKIPTTGDAIDLLSPELSTRDEFGIRTPTIEYAVRTS